VGKGECETWEELKRRRPELTHWVKSGTTMILSSIKITGSYKNLAFLGGKKVAKFCHTLVDSQ
jgi:hypothetical protein